MDKAGELFHVFYLSIFFSCFKVSTTPIYPGLWSSHGPRTWSTGVTVLCHYYQVQRPMDSYNYNMNSLKPVSWALFFILQLTLIWIFWDFHQFHFKMFEFNLISSLLFQHRVCLMWVSVAKCTLGIKGMLRKISYIRQIKSKSQSCRSWQSSSSPWFVLQGASSVSSYLPWYILVTQLLEKSTGKTREGCTGVPRHFLKCSGREKDRVGNHNLPSLLKYWRCA